MITKETAKSIAVCYEQIETAKKMIDNLKVIDSKEVKYGYYNEESDFQLRIKTNETGVYNILPVTTQIAIKIAKKTAEQYKEILFSLQKNICKELNIQPLQNAKMIDKSLAIEIFNKIVEIERAKKTKEETVNRSATGCELKLKLENNQFNSHLCLEIPANEKYSSIERISTDLFIDVIDNHINKLCIELQELNQRAKSVLQTIK